MDKRNPTVQAALGRCGSSSSRLCISFSQALCGRWVKSHGQHGPNALALVGIDETGDVLRTGVAQAHDERAATEGDAVKEVLADVIAEADADLKRRRDQAPEPKPKAEPMDPATCRFMQSDGGS